MPMPADEVESILREAFPDADITITDLAGDGDHYRAAIASSAFAGKSRVAQHQMVYAALKGRVGGQLHALALDTTIKRVQGQPPAPQPQYGAVLQPNQRALLSFFERDHGLGHDAAQGGAVPWLLALLAQHGIADVDGDIWLQTYPRVWGYTFKPVSFWYCHRADGSLAAVVAEVNNTFGERHCYLLAGAGLAWGRELQARKVFHVSPFCDVKGHYRFRFDLTGQRIFAQIDYHDGDLGADKLLVTTVHGDGVMPELTDLLTAWIARVLPDYTGMINLETMGGRIIEAQIRFPCCTIWSMTSKTIFDKNWPHIAVVFQLGRQHWAECAQQRTERENPFHINPRTRASC